MIQMYLRNHREQDQEHTRCRSCTIVRGQIWNNKRAKGRMQRTEKKGQEECWVNIRFKEGQHRQSPDTRASITQKAKEPYNIDYIRVEFETLDCF